VELAAESTLPELPRASGKRIFEPTPPEVEVRERVARVCQHRFAAIYPHPARIRMQGAYGPCCLAGADAKFEHVADDEAPAVAAATSFCRSK
jgi:hypothetical protein